MQEDSLPSESHSLISKEPKLNLEYVRDSKGQEFPLGLVVRILGFYHQVRSGQVRRQILQAAWQSKKKKKITY